jgi:hypothetical protein
MRKTTRFFQPFEINDLWVVVSVTTELTTKGTREVFFNIISHLAFVIISPLGGFGSLGSGCPQWVGAVGVDSRLDLGCCYSCSVLSSWHCSMDELGWLCSTVQDFFIVEQQRVEQNLLLHEDVGEPWVVED